MPPQYEQPPPPKCTNHPFLKPRPTNKNIVFKSNFLIIYIISKGYQNIYQIILIKNLCK